MINKLSLAKKLAVTTQFKEKDIRTLLEQCIALLIQSLSSGETVRLVGFGTFKIRNRKSRLARLPLTNAQVLIPASKRVVFISGKKLREGLNTGCLCQALDVKDLVS